ncbi:MAG: SufS family cysteine desulfurase [Lachnospiraceae bacterium]|nr:SufS family cysteine desulfurase [Lachnospiraceae bacterium]
MKKDLSLIRKDFPILASGDVVYFDNAATCQRPQQVLDAIGDFYTTHNANPLRGLYAWSVQATDAYEAARHRVARWLNAREDAEIIFVRNTTEAINLVAYSYALSTLKEGDEIVLSVSEHHSNLLPWQMAAQAKGAKLRFLEPDDDGRITEEMLKEVIGERTRIVALAQVSNVLGTALPIREAAGLAHEAGAVLLVDGAQGLPHMHTDVQEINCDFYAFSGHKLPGPMGIGVLYAKRELLEKMPPFLRGGEMIEYVKRDSATYAELPHRFEAGTVNAADAVGLAAALDYVEELGYEAIEEQEAKVVRIILEGLRAIPEVQVYGAPEAEDHHGIVTFNIAGCHPHDVASVLDEEGIAIRAGHHCAQPLMEYLQERYGMEFRATARASVAFYNTEEEARRFVEAVGKVRGWLGFGA